MNRLMHVTAWTLAVMLLAAPLAPAQTSDSFEGTWRLLAYKGGGNEGPVSGQLIFNRGRFAYVYTMNEQKERGDGRAHAGTYRVEGTDTVVFVLDWDVQFVNGVGTVKRQPSESRNKMTFEGNRLTLTFPNGASQTLERLP